MNRKILILFLFSLTLLWSCKKLEPPEGNTLPEGAEPYTESDIQFVPYSSSNLIFKNVPALDSTLELQFQERIRTEEYFAWDQTYFTFSSNPDLELELRLRYLQTENGESDKTLALYMPYLDDAGMYRTNIFEMPIAADTTQINTGFFKEHVTFHDTIIFNAVEWYDVYEVTELITTDPDKDGDENFERVYYNKIYGIIRMDQKNGTNWVLQQ